MSPNDHKSILTPFPPSGRVTKALKRSTTAQRAPRRGRYAKLRGVGEITPSHHGLPKRRLIQYSGAPQCGQITHSSSSSPTPDTPAPAVLAPAQTRRAESSSPSPPPPPTRERRRSAP